MIEISVQMYKKIAKKQFLVFITIIFRGFFQVDKIKDDYLVK